MNNEITKLNKEIKIMLLAFMVLLTLSGATAIPAQAELNALLPHIPNGVVYTLLHRILIALHEVNNRYPFLLYGYDWLAFAHFVIAIAFIGPFREPVKNIWVIEFGCIACVMIFPFALVMALYRGLPLWWVPVDYSFGAFGFALLWAVRNKIIVLEKVMNEEKLNLIF